MKFITQLIAVKMSSMWKEYIPTPICHLVVSGSSMTLIHSFIYLFRLVNYVKALKRKILKHSLNSFVLLFLFPAQYKWHLDIKSRFSRIYQSTVSLWISLNIRVLFECRYYECQCNNFNFDLHFPRSRSIAKSQWIGALWLHWEKRFWSHRYCGGHLERCWLLWIKNW